MPLSRQFQLFLVENSQLFNIPQRFVYYITAIMRFDFCTANFEIKSIVFTIK